MSEVDLVDEDDDDSEDKFEEGYEILTAEEIEEKNKDGKNSQDEDDERAATIAIGLEKPEKVKESLGIFFKDLHWAIGGQIPHDILFSERNINLIVNLGNSGRGFSNAIEMAYPLIESHGNDYGSFARSGPYREGLDIDMCLYVVYRIGRLNIPQGYLGGIFLIYLELCEGVKLV